uniref:Putative secreted peptide n=1 Tax=Anopheles braziliensis TaxID=58242 RepID=A0A2M3ZTH6_9DIPT
MIAGCLFRSLVCFLQHQILALFHCFQSLRQLVIFHIIILWLGYTNATDSGSCCWLRFNCSLIRSSGG